VVDGGEPAGVYELGWPKDAIPTPDWKVRRTGRLGSLPYGPGRLQVDKERTVPVPDRAGRQIDNKVVKQLYLFFTLSLPKIVFAGGKVPERHERGHGRDDQR
jgi:hypothetical protein